MIPLDISLIAERHELFIVLSIGEVVVSALAGGVYGHSDEDHRRLQGGHTDESDEGDDEGDDRRNEYEVVIVIVCLAFAIKVWYFDLYGRCVDAVVRESSSGTTEAPYSAETRNALSLPPSTRYPCFRFLICSVPPFQDPPKPTGAACAYRKHAMSMSPYRGLGWICLHIPLNIAIVMTGAVLEPLKLEGDFDVTSSKV